MQRTTWFTAFAFFVVVCGGFWALNVRQDWAVAQDRAEERADVLAHVLQEHAARAIEAADMVLALMLSQGRDGLLDDEDGRRRATQRLEALVNASPQVYSAWMLDAAGDQILSSWSYPPLAGNFAFRRYFHVHRAGERGLFVGPTETGSVTNAPRFTLSRPVINQDGAFAGVMVVSVDADYFTRFYDRAGLGTASSVHLLTLDGDALTGWPRDAQVPAADVAEVRARIAAGEGAGLLRPRDVDGTRAVAFRVLDGGPAMVMTSVDLGEGRADWRDNALRWGLVMSMALAGFTLLMLMGLNAAEREKRARKDLEAARDDLARRHDARAAEAERRREDLRVVADALPAFVAYIDAQGIHRFVNRTVQPWFGLTPEEVIGTPVRALIGEDAWQRSRPFHEAARAGQWVVFENILSNGRGGRREVEAQLIPCSGPNGEVGGYYAFGVDVTARRAAARALHDSERRYRQLFDAMDQGLAVCEVTVDGPGGGKDLRFLQVNPAFQTITGIPPAEAIGRTSRELQPGIADSLVDRLIGIANGAPAERFVHHAETPGRWYDIDAFQAAPGRVVTLFDDITERKEAEERQSLLMGELDHRVRNILASVQSMVLLTGRSATSKEQYAEILRGRLAAMARAHGILTARGWRGARLDQIVRDELAPLAGHPGGVAIDGPETCMLRPKEAINLALVIHELVTNAVKYGALSVPAGQVSVRWTVGEEGLRLVWEERGGPRVEPPQRRGFGSVLIGSALGGDGGTQVDLRFPPAGVCCVIVLPPHRLASGTEEASRASPPPAASKDSTGRPRLDGEVTVLVVEDELLIGMEIAAALDGAGLAVIGPFTTPAAALEAVETQAFDVALLDINLNGTLVVPVADALRARGVPILFASGHDVTTTLPPRFHDVPAVQKPVDMAVLALRLRTLAAGAETQRSVPAD